MALDPLSVLPWHGHLAKCVRDCTELSLGGRGLEQLSGFERLVNLEALYVNDNRLRCITGLEHNVRIKQLYVHNNRLCTLKGSLTRLKFLTHLDVSHNQLKGLGKVLATLQKLHFLQELNLQGNPCCEEPAYRLTVLSALPSLKVLDFNEVTTLERHQAARLTAGGSMKAPAVAFGSHLIIPPPQHQQQQHHNSSAATTGSMSAQQQQQSQRHKQQQQQLSVLEVELAQEVASIRQRQHEQAAAAEAELYSANPDAAYWESRSRPPNPAVREAQQTWAAATASSSACCMGLHLGTCAGGRTRADTATSTAAEWQELAAQGCAQGTFSYRTGGSGSQHAGAKQQPCC